MIDFHHPGFLWGLWALLIPPLIHLFRLQRRKVISFPDIRLLESLLRESRSTRKVTSLFLMLLRMMALACLVLGLAGPYVASSALKKDNTWVLVVDNSRVSGLQSGKTTLFQQAAAAADQILQAATEDTRIYFVDADTRFQPEALNQQEAREKLAQLKPSNRTLPASELPHWVQEWGQPSTLLRIGLPPGTPQVVDTLPWMWLTLPTGTGYNVRFDSLWTDPPTPLPGITFQLKVRVTHSGTPQEDARTEFQLWDGATLLGSQSMAVSEEESTLSFPLSPPDSSTGYALVALGDNLPGDDTLFFGFEPQQEPATRLLMDDVSLREALGRIFSNTSTPNQSVLVTDGSFQEALSAARQGQVAILISPKELPDGWISMPNEPALRLSRADVAGWMKPYLTEAPKENALPAAIPLGKPGAGWNALLRYENGWPFLLEKPFDAGVLYVINAKPGTWNTHPLMGVLFYALAYQRNTSALRLVFKHENKALSLPQANQRATAALKTSQHTYTPRQWINNQQLIISGMDLEAQAGIYSLVMGSEFQGMVGVNPNRSSGMIPKPLNERSMDGYPNTTFVSNVQSLEKQAVEGNETSWTPWLLLLALSFIVLESYWSQYRSA